MDMENTDELTALREKLRSQRPVAWDQLPDFPLYMDQVLSYMERQVFRFEEGDGLTAAMVTTRKAAWSPGPRARSTPGSTWPTSPSSAS